MYIAIIVALGLLFVSGIVCMLEVVPKIGKLGRGIFSIIVIVLSFIMVENEIAFFIIGTTIFSFIAIALIMYRGTPGNMLMIAVIALELALFVVLIMNLSQGRYKF